MEIGPDSDPAIFDASVLAQVQGLIPKDRLHMHLRDLDREHMVLVQCSPGEPGLQGQAHKIVSKAGMLGLTRMSKSAGELENACRSGAGAEAALRQCREAAGDIRLLAMPAAGFAPDSIE